MLVFNVSVGLTTFYDLQLFYNSIHGMRVTHEDASEYKIWSFVSNHNWRLFAMQLIS